MAMHDGTLVERLRTLGVFPDTQQSPNSVRENVNIFCQGYTLPAIRRELAKRHLTVSEEQFVFFHLEALLQQQPDYKTGFLARAQEELGRLGIKPAHIVEYFQSTNPGLVFIFRHEDEYSGDTMQAFYAKANQFALNSLRDWIGIPLAKPI